MIMQFLCSRDTKVSSYHMKNVELTFNDLPQVVAELRDEVIGMKVLLSDLQKGQTQQKIQRVRSGRLSPHAPEHPLHEVAEGRGARIETRQALGLVQ